MAIIAKLYQSNRKGVTNGKYYARATWREQYDLPKLAKHMTEHNSAFSRGQMLSVLTDIVSCIRELCLDSKKVKLDNLGFFYPSIHSMGANNIEDFSVKKHVIGVRIKFVGCGESKNSVFTQQAKVREADNYTEPKKTATPLP